MEPFVLDPGNTAWMLAAASVKLLMTGVMAVIIGLAPKYTMGWRIPAEREVVGVDLSTHGEAAHDLEPSSSGSGASGVLVW